MREGKNGSRIDEVNVHKKVVSENGMVSKWWDGACARSNK